jgi:D-sedoheptulose 7-phosphate isomerase
VSQFTDYISHLQSLLAATEDRCRSEIRYIQQTLARARTEGVRIFICGNGGSAATADHFACDLAKNARGFRALALGGHAAMLTALANDIGYTTVYAAQLEALAEANDILVAISVSGDSPNILAALRLAGHWGMRTIGLLGCNGGRALALCDLAVTVPSGNYAQVEDVHLAICHGLTETLKEVE